MAVASILKDIIKEIERDEILSAYILNKGEVAAVSRQWSSQGTCNVKSQPYSKYNKVRLRTFVFLIRRCFALTKSNNRPYSSLCRKVHNIKTT